MQPTLALNWTELIADIAGPMRPGDNLTSWLGRAARKSKLTDRQIRDLWDHPTKDPKTSIAFAVLVAADKAKKEAAQLAAQFESAAGSLNAQNDKGQYSADILALIDAARALRRVGI